MNKLFPLLAACVLSMGHIAIGGTEISQRVPAQSAEFFKGDASNFRIVSLSLGREIVKTVDVADDQCLHDAETPSDCHSVSYVKANVVHVEVSFDSDASQFEDGGKTVTLSLPQSQFTANEIAQIQKHGLDNSTKALVKLSVSAFKALTSSADVSKCSEYDGAFDCAEKVGYTTSTVSKIRVTVSR